jgi:hypothetical protein
LQPLPQFTTPSKNLWLGAATTAHLWLPLTSHCQGQPLVGGLSGRMDFAKKTNDYTLHSI